MKLGKTLAVKKAVEKANAAGFKIGERTLREYLKKPAPC